MNKYIFLTVTACAAIGAGWMGCGGNSGTGGSGTAGSGGKSTSSTSKMSTTKASSSTTGVTTGGGAGGAGFGGAGGGAPGIQCNPVTNAGCMATDACDIAIDQGTGAITGFVCYPPPNDATVCKACDTDPQNGPFCAALTTCFPTSQTAQECAQYCCTDADCGAGGECDVKDMFFAPLSTTLGVCLAKPSSGTGGSGTGGSGTGGHGTGGTGGSASSSSSSGSASSSTTGSGTGGSGAGGGSGTVALACSPPATAPSNGSCVTVGM